MKKKNRQTHTNTYVHKTIKAELKTYRNIQEDRKKAKRQKSTNKKERKDRHI